MHIENSKSNKNKKRTRNSNKSRVGKKRAGRLSNRTEVRDLLKLVKGELPKAQRAIKRVVTKGGSSSGDSSTNSLPLAAQRYALACANPFNPLARGVHGINNSKSSHKLTVIGRTTVTVANNSVLHMYISPSISNGAPHVMINVCTSAQDTQATSSFSNAAPTGTRSVVTLQTPYNCNFGQASAGLSGRVISFGVKFKFAGTVMNQGGMGGWYEDPSLTTDVLPTVSETPANTDIRLGAKTTFRPFLVTRQAIHEFSLHANPNTIDNWSTTATDGTFTNNGSSMTDQTQGASLVSFGAVGTYNVVQTPIGYLTFTNTTGNSLSLAFDFEQHLEYSGGIAMASQTPSPGMNEVGHQLASAIHEAKITHAQVPDRPLMNHVHEAIKNHMFSALRKTGSNLLSKAAANPGEVISGLAALAL